MVHFRIFGQFIGIYRVLNRMRKCLLLVFILALQSTIILGQALYTTQNRPAGLQWKELHSPHFRIIYPTGFDSSAYRAGRMLEHQYPKTTEYMGGTLKNFPFILVSYNDLSNGFVAPNNFRSEVDLAPFKGKSINPQSGSWMEAVLPHELVHANHISNIYPRSLPGLISLFSPDGARLFNMFPQLGVHEGIAVHYESTRGIHNESGRNNYPYYQNQFAVNLMQNKLWNMSQAFTVSDFTIPGNRHYIGSSHFTRWLHEKYGEESSQEMIRRHQYLFFLGYGFSMRQVTGKWPGALYREFQKAEKEREADRIAEIGATTDQHHRIISTPYDGVREHRPIWISDYEILFFSQQYNEASGFYIHDIRTSKTRKLAEAVAVGDYYMDYDAESNSLLYAEYFALKKYAGAYQSDLVSLNLETGEKTILTDRMRLFSPQEHNGKTIALQPNGDVANIVEMAGDSLNILKRFSDYTPIALAVNPVNEQEVAVLLNKRGVQAVWITEISAIGESLNTKPDIALPNASIHDITWHSSGERLLFSADVPPALNVYEWDRSTKEITQLTNAVYNAFEPSYMPDDAGITYITQVGQEQRIAILETDQLLNKPVKYSDWIDSGNFEERITTPFLGFDTEGVQDWEVKNYSSDFRWLKPRLVSPYFERRNSVNEWGATITSIDALQSQSYALQLTTLENMLWYDASYTNRTFYPGLRLRTFRSPEFFTFALNEGLFLSTLQEEQGAEIALPYQWFQKSLARTSLLRLTPSISYSRIRYHNQRTDVVSDFSTQYSARLSSQLFLGLQQLYRDVQPSRGLVLYATLERTLNSPEVEIEASNTSVLRGFRSKRGAILAGVNAYMSPYRKRNHSLRLTAQILEQTDFKLFNTENILPLGFNTPEFEASSSLAKFSTRYAIPLIYPDKGGFLVPLYVSSVYITGFTHTLLNYQNSADLSNTQTILGMGIHFQFKISNLAFEIGTGFAFNPSNNNTEFIIGSF